MDHGLFSRARFQDVIYSSANREPTAIRKDSKSQKIRFGYLGQIETSKGVELVIDQFARRTDTGWELAIAGKGIDAYVSSLKSLPRSGQIQWHGWVDSSNFLSQLDVLVVPSLWEEPLPRVILEAYQHGIPVIASARGGIPEIVDNEVSGLLFDPSEPSNLDALVGRILASPALLHRLKEGAATKAQEFTPERTASGYLRAYESVLAH